jgi:hypothetical protein
MLQSPVGIATLIVSFVPNKFTRAADDKYAQLLARLIKLTEEHVHKHFAADASVMASIAQRVNHELKIKASIE